MAEERNITLQNMKLITQSQRQLRVRHSAGMKSRDSSVGIVTGYGLVHPASYTMGTGGSFPRDKEGGA
jgi:hypothetical protein